MTGQLSLDQAAFGSPLPCAPGRKRTDGNPVWRNVIKFAEEVLDDAEGALLVEQARPASIEHYRRLADLLDRRARAWAQLARTQEGHASRAMHLAADGDVRQARAIRRRLGAAK